MNGSTLWQKTQVCSGQWMASAIPFFYSGVTTLELVPFPLPPSLISTKETIKKKEKVLNYMFGLLRLRTLFHLSLYLWCLTQSVACIQYSLNIPWVIKWTQSPPSCLILPFSFPPPPFIFFWSQILSGVLVSDFLLCAVTSDRELKTNLILGKRHTKTRIKKKTCMSSISKHFRIAGFKKMLKSLEKD